MDGLKVGVLDTQDSELRNAQAHAVAFASLCFSKNDNPLKDLSGDELAKADLLRMNSYHLAAPRMVVYEHAADETTRTNRKETAESLSKAFQSLTGVPVPVHELDFVYLQRGRFDVDGVALVDPEQNKADGVHYVISDISRQELVNEPCGMQTTDCNSGLAAYGRISSRFINLMKRLAAI